MLHLVDSELSGAGLARVAATVEQARTGDAVVAVLSDADANADADPGARASGATARGALVRMAHRAVAQGTVLIVATGDEQVRRDVGAAGPGVRTLEQDRAGAVALALELLDAAGATVPAAR